MDEAGEEDEQVELLPLEPKNSDYDVLTGFTIRQLSVRFAFG